MYNNTTIQQHNNTTMQQYNNTTIHVQQYNNTIQQYNTTIQQYKTVYITEAFETKAANWVCDRKISMDVNQLTHSLTHTLLVFSDINECAAPNNCQQVCRNLPGRYKCSCHEGFDLMPDEVSCRCKCYIENTTRAPFETVYITMSSF